MKYTFLYLAASVGMLAACSGINEHNLEKEPILDEGLLVEQVIFEVPVIRSLGEDNETKASLSQEGDDDIRFGWESTDTVGIYPDQGAQVFFSMADGVGTNEASFDGGGWKLRQMSTYSCYFPFVGDLYLERDAIPVSFTGQEQIGISNHDGVRFYLASEGASSESGSLHFTFQMLNTIIRIKAIGLPAGTYTKLSLQTDEALFVQNGSFGLDNMEISGKSYSNTLDISLKEFTLTEASTEANPVLVYLTSAPVDLTGKQLTILVYSDDNCIYGCEKTVLIPFEAGAWGGLKCGMNKKSVLFYTSSDKEIVTPFAPDAFGSTLISNEYNGSMGMLVFDTDVTQIGDHAFENCNTLTGITIPESVTSIGEGAFRGCTNLASIDIPDSVLSINDYTFAGCQNIVTVTIPENTTSIGAGAFENCIKLTGITIPGSVTSIGEGAFSNCEALTSFIIPKDVTTIGALAFNGCTGLTYITVYAENPADVTESTFANSNNCLIYVSSGSLNNFRTATGWSNFASRICDHVYVDMGNGMKWATTNVGAIGPDDYGDYFTWGGTEPVTPSMNSTSSSFTDTANAIWGGSWRMPTYEEWEALLNPENYDWDFTGDGYTVTSKVSGCNGNTIFLPAAGTVGEETLMGDGWDGYYWSSAQHPDSGYGWGLLFERSYDNVYMGRYVFYGGCSVRPIYESTPNGGMEKPNYPETEINL